jgi:hypothetical protein
MTGPDIAGPGPKSVNVRGYFRKDGTYVRAHHLSPSSQRNGPRAAPVSLGNSSPLLAFASAATRLLSKTKNRVRSRAPITIHSFGDHLVGLPDEAP